MNFYKLEKKFGKYAIHNLSMWLIAGYVLGYILQLVAPSAMSMLFLDPYCILHGQVWRIISWILVPPTSLGIFTIINLLFFYTIGNSLEKMWGTFRYNIFMFLGMLAVIIGVFLLYAVGCLTGLFSAGTLEGRMIYSSLISLHVSTYYINISMLLAFAMTIPDMQVLFMFIIPLKMKWLAYIEIAFLALDFFANDIIGKIVMIISLLNFIIFFVSSKRVRINPAQIRRRREFRRQTSTATGFASSITRHKCAICGRTEKDDPSLVFRFCSKCNGNYEYCQDHLFTHTHIE